MTLKPPGSPNTPVNLSAIINAQTDFGARGDNSADDTGPLQRAIASAISTGMALYIPTGTYKITGSLTSTATGGLKVFGDGPGLTVLSHQISGAHMFGGLGTLGSTVAIGAGSSVGATSLTVASTTGLAAGDVLVVRDTSNVVYGNSGKTAAGVAGEIARIRSVDSSTGLTLYGRLDYAYTTSGDIRLLTAFDGLEISDLTIKNPNPGTMATTDRAISCVNGRNVRITNVEFRDMDASCIRLQNVIDFEINRCKFRDTRDLESGNAPYCIHLANTCQNGVVSSCWGRYGRHLFTSGGGTATEPQPAHVLIDGCIGTEFSEAVFDTHPGARWHTFVACHAHNTLASGFQIRGPDTHVINPVVSQATNGVAFVYGADRGMVIGGRLSGCDYGINIDSCNDVVLKGGLRVQNPVTNGVYIKESASWSGYTTDFTVDDVTVTGTPATAAFNFNAWNDSFRVGRIYARDATTKTTGTSVNTPTSYGLYHDGFPGLIAPTSFTDSIASVTETANLAVFVRFVPTRNMTITKLRFVVTTAAGADDAVDVGIYGPNASANVLTRLVSSGATTGKLNSTGPKEISVSATKLVAGTVYFAAMSWGTLGGTAAVLVGAGTNNTNANQLMSSTDAFYEIALSKASSHPLPATISGPSNIANGVKMGVME